MASFSVLIVDDYAPLRRVVRSILEEKSDLRVIGEASDGLEAIQKSTALQPDLILLDIGLPKLNGIAAARRLRELVPRAKILFLSEEASRDVVEEAIRLGAAGYIHKLNTQSELLPAIESIRKGEPFVGRGVQEYFSESLTTQTAPRHEMLIYSDDAVFLEASTRFIAAALRSATPVIAAATKPHLDRLLQSLEAEGLDVDDRIRRGALVPLDAVEKLSRFMVNNLPDQHRCMNAMSSLVETIRSAKGGHSRIAFCGECSPLLLAQGNAEAAICLEELSNDLAIMHELDILCAYPLSSFDGGEDNRAFKNIRSVHSAVHYR